MKQSIFLKKYTDPNDKTYILCKTKILLDYINKYNTINIKPHPPSNKFVLWKNDNMSKIKSFFDDFESQTIWNLDNKKKYYNSKGLPIPSKEGKPKLIELITIKAGIIWKSVSNLDKITYSEKRSVELTKYNKSKSTCKLNGWNGPFYNKEISKTIKDSSKKTIKYVNTFDEAIKIAETLGNNCYGITQTKDGNKKRFSVRTGKLVKNNKMVASWIKTNYIAEEINRGRPKKTSYLIDTDEYQEDINNSIIKITLINHNGIDYYLNENTNIIYYNGKIVGKYINNAIQFL